MEEIRKNGPIKELEKCRDKLGESVSHLKKLRKEIKLSIKRLERKRKLPVEAELQANKIDQMILISFFSAYLSILNRASETIKEGLEELEKEVR